MSDTEYLMSSKANMEHLMKSIEQHKGNEEEENIVCFMSVRRNKEICLLVFLVLMIL